jgi:hypothetical protein
LNADPTPPIFITARFRSGSTMLWNLFRQLPDVRAYYEPLHDRLASLIKFPQQPEKSHLFVKSSYFDEYKSFPEIISLHQSAFANHRLYLGADESFPELQVYIKTLVESNTSGHTTVLQFNRIDFRLAWIKKNFPQARLLHLARNPRDQWYSTLAPFKVDIDHDIDFDAYDLATWGRDLYQQFPFLAAPQIRHAYQRFYYLWKLSYLAGQRLSELSINYDEVISEPQNCLNQILDFANLYSDKNLQVCLKLVESKPERAWKKDRKELWFSDLEQECEMVLDALGLNKNFALIPLSDIQEQSSRYQALLHEPKNKYWATKSFKQAIAHDRNEIYETHYHYQKTISSLERAQFELDGVRAELDGVRAELDGVRAELDGVRAELDGVYQSISWRFTAPVRVILSRARVWRSKLTQLKNRSTSAPAIELKNKLTGFLYRVASFLRQIYWVALLLHKVRHRFPRLWETAKTVVKREPMPIQLVLLNELALKREKHFLDLFQREIDRHQTGKAEVKQ